eukprot:2703954-Amphidinium_carterae.1
MGFALTKEMCELVGLLWTIAWATLHPVRMVVFHVFLCLGDTKVWVTVVTSASTCFDSRVIVNELTGS